MMPPIMAANIHVVSFSDFIRISCFRTTSSFSSARVALRTPIGPRPPRRSSHDQALAHPLAIIRPRDHTLDARAIRFEHAVRQAGRRPQISYEASIGGCSRPDAALGNVRLAPAFYRCAAGLLAPPSCAASLVTYQLVDVADNQPNAEEGQCHD